MNANELASRVTSLRLTGGNTVNAVWSISSIVTRIPIQLQLSHIILALTQI